MERYTDESRERLYREYSRERDEGLTPAQIADSGVYGSEAPAFAARYASECAAYAEAMIEHRRFNRDHPVMEWNGAGRYFHS